MRLSAFQFEQFRTFVVNVALGQAKAVNDDFIFLSVRWKIKEDALKHWINKDLENRYNGNVFLSNTVVLQYTLTCILGW